LEDAIQSLVDVLNAPEIRAAIDDIKATVDGVASALEQLSFAPVTDEVVGFIDKMRAALAAALRQDINEAAKTALTAGLAALPRDLQPVTDPLIDDFARLIEQGPISLLERVRDEPRKIVERLRKFEPAALIGTSLEQSHRQLAAKLDDLSVRALLAPAKQALDAQKRRLLKTANPASALQPLSDALADIRSKLDRLSPGALLAPLERSLQE